MLKREKHDLLSFNLNFIFSTFESNEQLSFLELFFSYLYKFNAYCHDGKFSSWVGSFILYWWCWNFTFISIKFNFYFLLWEMEENFYFYCCCCLDFLNSIPNSRIRSMWFNKHQVVYNEIIWEKIWFRLLSIITNIIVTLNNNQKRTLRKFI